MPTPTTKTPGSRVASQAEPGSVSGRSRERILSVAAERFLAAGYVETSLRDVAGDAGMKAGSLYYHFASKDQLLTAVLERGMDIMVEAFEAAAGCKELGDSEMLQTHVEAHLHALHDNRPYTAGHVTLFRTAPPVVRDAIVPLRDGYESRWTELLARLLPGRSRSEITMLRLTLFGAMNASIDWFDAGRGNVASFARLVTDQFWYGAVRSKSGGMEAAGGMKGKGKSE